MHVKKGILSGFILLTIVLAIVASGVMLSREAGLPVRQYSYTVIHTYPHDRTAWTEGLVYQDGLLYESTGRLSQSSLRIVDPLTGKILRVQNLSPLYYGEGLSILGNRIYQLTYRNRICLVHNLSTLEQISTFTYTTEGWGLTNNGTDLIMSDGSADLSFIDPDTFQVVKQVTVQNNGVPVTNLNELEYIKGKIYANIWLTDNIAIIDPENGDIEGMVNMTGLLPQSDQEGADVLNGIAYDPSTDRIFVTGKLWPDLFEVRFVSE
jgi:glutamine cyclotransferase